MKLGKACVVALAALALIGFAPSINARGRGGGFGGHAVHSRGGFHGTGAFHGGGFHRGYAAWHGGHGWYGHGWYGHGWHGHGWYGNGWYGGVNFAVGWPYWGWGYPYYWYPPPYGYVPSGYYGGSEPVYEPQRHYTPHEQPAEPYTGK